MWEPPTTTENTSLHLNVGGEFGSGRGLPRTHKIVHLRLQNRKKRGRARVSFRQGRQLPLRTPNTEKGDEGRGSANRGRARKEGGLRKETPAGRSRHTWAETASSVKEEGKLRHQRGHLQKRARVGGAEIAEERILLERREAPKFVAKRNGGSQKGITLAARVWGAGGETFTVT